MTDLGALPYVDWLPHQRWYGGRHRTIAEARPEAVTQVGDDLFNVLLGVRYDGAAEVERYELFVRLDRPPHDEYVARALIGAVHEPDGRERLAYEALFDGDAARHVLRLIADGVTVDNLRFVPEPGVKLPVDEPARVGDAEQSNTSVVFDSAALMKVFRRVLPGINPDLELNRALARAGSKHVAPLLGAIESTSPEGEPLTLAMVSGYARNSAEGWEMATASARDLLNESDLHADEVGGDFSGESFRLGEAVGSVHRTLASELGETREQLPVDAMSARLDRAAETVPDLRPYADRIRDALRRAGDQPVPMQRVHGDLHLGQVLRTPAAWLLIDFEGEPGQPIDERRRPDSPLRDVAGMLRSFEYAAYQLMVSHSVDEDRPADKLEKRAREWIDRNQDAFCAGYAEVAGSDPREQAAVLGAYELDKMAYEAAYEARHRPAWLRIPMKSIARLLG